MNRQIRYVITKLRHDADRPGTFFLYGLKTEGVEIPFKFDVENDATPLFSYMSMHFFIDFENATRALRMYDDGNMIIITLFITGAL